MGEKIMSSVDIPKAFTMALATGQEYLKDHAISDGTASNIVYIKNNDIYCVNTGDSRSVLCRNDKAFPLSYDHKPDSESERKRIEKAGGFVTESKRVNGVLALSRALGDVDLQPPVTYEPDIIHTKLQADDKFIIMGCDGLWD